MLAIMSGLDFVDFDVHQGNDTEHIFKAEPRVLFRSGYQHLFVLFAQLGQGYPDMTDRASAPLQAGTRPARFNPGFPTQSNRRSFHPKTPD